MNPQTERRAAHPDPDDALSPEILALLVTCGAAIRKSDRIDLSADRRHDVPERRGVERRHRDRRSDDPRTGSALKDS